jgi:hypothetical protein
MALKRFLMLSIALGLAALGRSPVTQPVHAQAIDPVVVLLQYWDSEDRGDVDTAVAQFAPDATFIGTMPSGICSVSTPCTDLAGIRRQIQRNTGSHFCTRIHWIQVSGAVVTGEREIQSDFDYSIGVDHVVQNFMAVIQQGKITFEAGVLNVGDPLTDYAVDIDLGTQPPRTPILTPRPLCPRLAQSQ